MVMPARPRPTQSLPPAQVLSVILRLPCGELTKRLLQSVLSQKRCTCSPSQSSPTNEAAPWIGGRSCSPMMETRTPSTAADPDKASPCWPPRTETLPLSSSQDKASASPRCDDNESDCGLRGAGAADDDDDVNLSASFDMPQRSNLLEGPRSRNSDSNKFLLAFLPSRGPLSLQLDLSVSKEPDSNIRSLQSNHHRKSLSQKPQ